jgi:hypothetical protein
MCSSGVRRHRASTANKRQPSDWKTATGDDIACVACLHRFNLQGG